MKYMEAGTDVRHRCLIYEDAASELLPIVVPLLVDALRDGCRGLYLGSPDDVSRVKRALGEAGLDVEAELARGALVFSSERGAFEPEAMVEELSRLVEAALRDGFAGGLCATGDMAWETNGEANLERLLEYEARLEVLLKRVPLRGICQYRRGSLPARALHDALLTHRQVFLGADLRRENPFYMPPDLILNGFDPVARDVRGEWMRRQLERAARAERERAAELSAVNEELQSFGYSVSHDLRAPLRHIEGFAQIIQRRYAGDLGAEGQEYFGLVLQGVKRMSDLLDALSGFSTASRADLKHEPVDLTAEAEDVVCDLRRREPQRPVAAEIQQGLTASGDRRLLAAALGNLLGNAWKFTGRTERPAVCFGAEPREGRTVFFVRDNGAGFASDQRSRLFKPFARLHARADYPGSGVGLATTRRIIRRHGGEIWAEGEIGKGATFYFTL